MIFCWYFKGYYICKIDYFYAKMMVIDFCDFVNMMAYLDFVFPKIEKSSSLLFTFTILKFPIEFKIEGYQMWLDSFFDIGTFFKIPCTDTLFWAYTSGNKISLKCKDRWKKTIKIRMKIIFKKKMSNFVYTLKLVLD